MYEHLGHHSVCIRAGASWDPDLLGRALFTALQATFERTDADIASVNPFSISSPFCPSFTSSTRPFHYLFFRSSRCRFSSDAPAKRLLLPELWISCVKGLRKSLREFSRAARASRPLFGIEPLESVKLRSRRNPRGVWLFVLPLTHEASPSIHSKRRTAPKCSYCIDCRSRYRREEQVRRPNVGSFSRTPCARRFAPV